jgi:hypothetical protein
MSAKPILSFIDMLALQPTTTCEPISEPEKALSETPQTLRDKNPELTDDEKADLILNKANFKKAVKFQDHEKAIEFQSAVLELTKKQWGLHHLRTVDAMCQLAQSHLKNHEPDMAKGIYFQALRIGTEYFPDAKATLAEIQSYITQCTEASRLSMGISHLSMHMNHIHRTEQIAQQVSSALKGERLLKIGQRLFAKQHFGRAATAFKAWSELVLPNADTQDETVFEHIASYGQALMGAGRLPEAQHVFKQVVSHRHTHYSACPTGIPLQKALLNWAESLRQSGEESSATMTARLADKVRKPANLDSTAL